MFRAAASAFCLSITIAACSPTAPSDAARDTTPSRSPASDFDVTVGKVALNVLELPNARVTIRNKGSATYSSVDVKCLFVDQNGADIGDGLALFHDIGPGMTDTTDAMSAEQRHRPARADCRVESARTN